MTFNPKATLAERQQAVANLITQLKADQQPIILGPWRSEVGFEGLYWLPFLHFLASRVPGFKDRAVAISRGGFGTLYGAISAASIDLYALRSVIEVRRENLYDHQVTHGGKTQKQLLETKWDEEVCHDAADSLKLPLPYHVIHPSWMYWALSPYWDENAGLKYLDTLCDFTPIAKPALPKDCPLPPKYVAVKFYGRSTFPFPYPGITEIAQQIVATIAAQVPVVILSGGPEYDDHVEGQWAGPNILTLPSSAPDINLAVQASVLAHAQAFVGTYGGMAQLALRLGVPSVSLYSQWGGTSHAHLALSSWLSKATNVPFVVGSLTDVTLWRQLTSVPMSALQPKPEMVTA